MKEIFQVNEKWKLASKSKVSGNTTNIGSIHSISEILDGKSIFENEEEFDKYWTNQ